MKANWERVGYINVDSGHCWIGDPCYVVHPEQADSVVGASYEDFWCMLWTQHVLTRSNIAVFGKEVGGAVNGGYCINVGWDSQYPVDVRYDRYGDVAEARIRFR